MNTPSVEDIQGWTELPALKNADPTKAEQLVAIAIAMFKRITGVTDLEPIPADDAPVVQRAMTGLAEMMTYQQSPEYLETLSDWDLIASFSAGPYSETHRSPEDARKARLLVAWPWLSELLWLFVTPERYDFWMTYFSGQQAPAFEVTETDWAAGQDRLGGSYQSDEYLGNPYFFGA